ncbi:hypothetical protein GCM10020358_54820 [Amorphoplanes nipponensis]|uniref:N-acetyltransferase domain-containing protein n=1 Tax=Actinoplanes nipponensis TaxID=135950 RepID=A0A919MR82_9ACTN|nr:GNAT family N-acetyltransferase [Actinoplanes nipponensis]GIE54396.1 hypothetical protein Ani05nite_79300 [Actinoplanes nipponensis]
MMETDRLRLAPLDVPLARAVVAGDREGRAWHPEFPTEDDREACAMTLRAPDPAFGSHVVVERESGLAVGTIGCYGPPDAAGTLMIGYGLVPAARGRGYATEALRALVVHAFAQPSVREITADTLTDNVASQKVLEKAGFTHTHSTAEARWYRLNRPDKP